MRWDIEGVNRHSGEEVNIFVEAEDEEGARAAASARNVLVSHVEPLPFESAVQPSIPSTRKPPFFAARRHLSDRISVEGNRHG